MKLTPVGWVDGIQDVFSDIYSILPKVNYRIWKSIINNIYLYITDQQHFYYSLFT